VAAGVVAVATRAEVGALAVAEALGSPVDDGDGFFATGDVDAESFATGAGVA
jgi:hypothetical protein